MLIFSLTNWIVKLLVNPHVKYFILLIILLFVYMNQPKIKPLSKMELLQEFYETTLEALKDAKNDRLWFKTNTKLGKLYYDRGEFNKLAKILKQLHQSCQNDDGSDDLKKGTQLLEIYALEIQMYTAQKNNKKLKVILIIIHSNYYP